MPPLLLVIAFMLMWAVLCVNRRCPRWYAGLRPDLRELLFYLVTLAGWMLVTAAALMLLGGA